MLKQIITTTTAALAIGAACACGNFDVTNPNQPTLDDLLSNPTRQKLSAAAIPSSQGEFDLVNIGHSVEKRGSHLADLAMDLCKVIILR